MCWCGCGTIDLDDPTGNGDYKESGHYVDLTRWNSDPGIARDMEQVSAHIRQSTEARLQREHGAKESAKERDHQIELAKILTNHWGNAHRDMLEHHQRHQAIVQKQHGRR